MKQVLESPQLSTSDQPDKTLRAWAAYLTPLFNAIGFRLNRCFPKDGSEGLNAYTVATRPAAPDGTIIYVSDGAAGANFQGRAGGAWVNLG